MLTAEDDRSGPGAVHTGAAVDRSVRSSGPGLPAPAQAADGLDQPTGFDVGEAGAVGGY